MHKLSLLLGLLLLLSTAAPFVTAQEDGDDDTPTTDRTIAQVVTDFASADEPQFTRLLAAVRSAEAGVLETLADPDATLTVFAPTDAAFEVLELELGRRPAEEALNTPNVAASILLYHTLPFELSATELAELLDTNDGFVTVPTAQGQYIDIGSTEEGPVLDSTARLVLDQVDIAAANGVIHVIDAVLLPEAGTVAEVLSDNYASADPPQFSALLDAVAAADPAISDYLSELENDFTLFAPVDAAFAEAALPDDPTATLQYHVVPERLGSAAIRDLLDESADDTLTVEALDGATLTLRIDDDGRLLVNGAVQVLASDIDAVNGVIHAVDAVLGTAE